MRVRSKVRAGSSLSRVLDTRTAAQTAAGDAREQLGGAPCTVAVLFASTIHLPDLALAADEVRRQLAPAALVGGVAGGVVGPATEVEDEPALSVWCASFDGEAIPFRTWAVRSTARSAVVGWPDTRPDDLAIVLADPYTYPIGSVVDALAEARPGHPLVGGLITGGPGASRLVSGTDAYDDGAVGVVLRGAPVQAIVSQGCRPVGEPYVVTRAEGNVIHELGGQPAAERLHALLVSASAEERPLIQRGLQIGLVADEYRDEFATGDFLIRGVIAADVDAGTVTVGDRVEVGQTVQFQVRDAASAHAELDGALRERGEAAGALLFTCNGRGRRFFGEPDHDVALVEQRLGATVAGAFCAGVVGPVGSRSYIHGFTASLAIFGGDADR